MADMLRGAPEERGRYYPRFALDADGAARRFFVARGGLRRLRGDGEPFLGYPARDLFWQDLLELVHEDDLPKLRALISLLVDRPGGSGIVEVRLRDVSGAWRRVEAKARNAPEAPDDPGLLFVDVAYAPNRL